MFYRRYSDDLVFVCRNEQKDEILLFIDQKIKGAMLKINVSKSFIIHFKKINEDSVCEKVTDGLGEQKTRDYVDYLGLEFNGKNILLRKNTIQKLKHKQIKKAKKQLLNSIKSIRRNPKKIGKKTKNRNNYFKKVLEVVNNKGIQKQVLKVTKDRNKIKKNKS